ncbi:MAG: hypothetical protein HYU54_11285 [Actinobacteria bacterium]|nr:hypothetical protein [Actinomycetota bacterium]
MALFSRLSGLRRSRLFRAVVGGSAFVGAAAGGATGAVLLSGEGNAPAEAAQPAAKVGVQQVSLDVERKKVRVRTDRSLLTDSLDASSAGATSLHSPNTPNTPDNTGGAENTGNTPNTPDNTGGADDSPSQTSSSVQGSNSGGGDGVSDGADDSPSNTS